jgi:hypothetical protein
MVPEMAIHSIIVPKFDYHPYRTIHIDHLVQGQLE